MSVWRINDPDGTFFNGPLLKKKNLTVTPKKKKLYTLHLM